MSRRRARSRRDRRPTHDDAVALFVQQVHIAIAHSDGCLVREFIFHPLRKWRFDVAVPGLRIAIEVEGAIFKGRQAALDTAAWTVRAGAMMTAADVKALRMMGGRHNQPTGMRGDIEKYAEAASLGWIVLRVMPEMVVDGRALTWFERVWTLQRDIQGALKPLTI